MVEQTEDIKTIELGTLTFDENKTLQRIIHCGLGVGIDPNTRANEPEKSPTKNQVVKQEPPDDID